MKTVIREIKWGTSEYDEEVALRDKILRKPLGLEFSQTDLQKEKNDTHLGAYIGEKLVGCLLLTPLSKTKIKMRQVAIDTSVQGQGVGRFLVEASEKKAKELGFEEMELSARESAIPFYLRLNYELFGEAFIEVTIPHQKMKKMLK